LPLSFLPAERERKGGKKGQLRGEKKKKNGGRRKIYNIPSPLHGRGEGKRGKGEKGQRKKRKKREEAGFKRRKTYAWFHKLGYKGGRRKKT